MDGSTGVWAGGDGVEGGFGVVVSVVEGVSVCDWVGEE